MGAHQGSAAVVVLVGGFVIMFVTDVSGIDELLVLVLLLLLLLRMVSLVKVIVLDVVEVIVESIVNLLLLMRMRLGVVILLAVLVLVLVRARVVRMKEGVGHYGVEMICRGLINGN